MRTRKFKPLPTHIWLVRDAAPNSFADYVDLEKMFGLKLDEHGYDRLRTFAAVHILPEKEYQTVKFNTSFVRTLWWGDYTDETSSVLMRMLGIGSLSLRSEIGPDDKKWQELLEQHGPSPFATSASIQKHFPQLLEGDGKRIAEFAQTWARELASPYYQSPEPHYLKGYGTVFVMIEPMLSAAVHALTGVWPSREVKPAEGFRLVFDEDKLISVEQLWIELSSGSEKIPVPPQTV